MLKASIEEEIHPQESGNRLRLWLPFLPKIDRCYLIEVPAWISRDAL